VDLIAICVSHAEAMGRTFLVSDDEDLSTPELVRRIAECMGLTPRLLPVPPALLRLAGKLTDREAEVQRLTGSLQVDIGYTRDTLGWKPPLSVDQGLALAVADA
jgi:nucleoside-diphosphate-sugar epimerase